MKKIKHIILVIGNNTNVFISVSKPIHKRIELKQENIRPANINIIKLTSSLLLLYIESTSCKYLCDFPYFFFPPKNAQNLMGALLFRHLKITIVIWFYYTTMEIHSLKRCFSIRTNVIFWWRYSFCAAAFRKNVQPKTNNTSNRNGCTYKMNNKQNLCYLFAWCI